MPATPGSVSVALEQGHQREQEQQVHEHRQVRDDAGHLVIEEHEANDQHDADHGAHAALLDGVLAQRRADQLLVRGADRRGQRAGAQHDHQVLGLFQGVVVGAGATQRDLAVAAADLGLDHGGALHAVVEHDGHAALHVATRELAELVGALLVELERHVRLVVFLIEGREGLLHVFTAHVGAREEQVGAPGLLALGSWARRRAASSSPSNSSRPSGIWALMLSDVALQLLTGTFATRHQES